MHSLGLMTGLYFYGMLRVVCRHIYKSINYCRLEKFVTKNLCGLQCMKFKSTRYFQGYRMPIIIFEGTKLYWI